MHSFLSCCINFKDLLLWDAENLHQVLMDVYTLVLIWPRFVVKEKNIAFTRRMVIDCIQKEEPAKKSAEETEEGRRQSGKKT